jgi:serine phosphatase RsbU (regulator of sigma subunit)
MVQEQEVQVRERERIEQELRTAQAIQHAFLPKDVPAFPGWQLARYYQSAREVGGDFYDFLVFDDGRLGLIIGDVTGKGVPAALVMATVHTMLRTAAVQGMISPGRVLARVNDLLSADIPPGMFVTCFFAILDPKSGHMRYANAGQELPYRRHNGGVSELWATGMPLGMMPGTHYEEQEVTLCPGESILFYSDGLVEAHNTAYDMFDYSRLSALIEAYPGDPSLIDFLLNELATFTGNEWDQEDDVTMMTLFRAP